MKNTHGETVDLDDSQSLTASDFEVLNSENFFDKINDVFTSKPHLNPRLPNHAHQNHGRRERANKSVASQISREASVDIGSIIHKSQMNLSHNLGLNSQDTAAIQLLKQQQVPLEIDTLTGLPKFPAFDKNMNYLDEYWNMY